VSQESSDCPKVLGLAQLGNGCVDVPFSIYHAGIAYDLTLGAQKRHRMQGLDRDCGAHL